MRIVPPEVVARTFPEGTGQIDVVAIYEVKDLKIVSAWFIYRSPVLDPKP